MTPWQLVNSELLRRQKNWQWLATALGMDIQRVHNWKNRGIPAKQYRPIADILQVTINWIEGLEPLPCFAEKGMSWSNDRLPNDAFKEIKKLNKVPLIDWASVSDFCGSSDSYPVEMAKDWIYCPSKHEARAFALNVCGESMHNSSGSPTFKDGDLIYIDPDRAPTHKSLVICCLDDNFEAIFKRLLLEGGVKMLESLNPSWPERIIKMPASATICGVVIGRYDEF